MRHVPLRKLTQRQSGRAGVADDFVVHVGQVHDVEQFIAAPFQMPPQDVHEDERAEVADVGEVIDRRPTGVHPYPPPFERDEWLPLACQ